MSSSATFLTLTPLIPAGESMENAISYFTENLGFIVDWQDVDGAGIRRGGVTLNLVRNGDRHWAENCSCSIGVSDLNALHDEYRAAGVALGKLETKPWGRQEFHMILPSGVCLQFYQSPEPV